MATWTNNGLALAAQSGVQNTVAYVAIGTGCGTLATALTSGTAYTALALDAPLPVSLAASTPLTLTDGTNTQTVTVGGSGAAQGVTSIPVSSFTASANFAAHTTGVCPTPRATDLTLYNEQVRVAANPGTAGATPGESFNSGYFDGTQPSALYLQVGYFGGSTATSSANSGTLMIADIQYWSHTQNVDTNMFQADSVI